MLFTLLMIISLADGPHVVEVTGFQNILMCQGAGAAYALSHHGVSYDCLQVR